MTTLGLAAWPRPSLREYWLRRRPGPLLFVVIVIVVAQLPYLVGLVSPNPMLVYSNLVSGFHGGILPGGATIDPNAGFTGQALGHLAMQDWLHGRVPLWNPYEGVGAPLAGEMQSGAFFPFNVFLLLPSGQAWLYLLLNLVAGVSTFALMRRLGVRSWVAAACGVVFGLDGTFAWFRFQAANPVAFLPLLLLGIERARSAAGSGLLRGWRLVAIAMALSILAGFPEMAYLDGVGAAIWAVARLPGLGRGERIRYLGRLALGALGGLLLAAPLLVAFVDYLPHAYLGAHSGAFLHAYLPRLGASALLFPYIFGPIFGFSSYGTTGSSLAGFWGSVGGYLTVGSTLLAVLSLAGRRLRLLRLVLVLWALLLLGRTFGIPPAVAVVNSLPGAGSVAIWRYSMPVVEMAVVVLAGLGAEDLLTRERGRRWILVAAGAAVGVLCVLGVHEASPIVRGLTGAPDHGLWSLASIVWAALVLGTLVGAGVLGAGRNRMMTVAIVGVMTVDAAAMFMAPELSAPRSGQVDMAAISFLRSHLGVERFFSLGTLLPNYGSYFGVSSLDTNDLPVPKAWNHLVTSTLDPATNGILFTGFTTLDPNGPSAEAAFVQHSASYEALGVKYLLTPANVPEPALKPPTQLRPVYRDSVVAIYELPAARPLFDAAGGSCQVRAVTVQKVDLRCRAPEKLSYLELYIPGWSASISGKPAKVIGSPTGIGMEVAVPAGTSSVVFSYSIPHGDLGVAALALGVALLIVSAAGGRQRSAREPIPPDHRVVAVRGEGANGPG